MNYFEEFISLARKVAENIDCMGYMIETDPNLEEYLFEIDCGITVDDYGKDMAYKYVTMLLYDNA